METLQFEKGKEHPHLELLFNTGAGVEGSENLTREVQRQWSLFVFCTVIEHMLYY
jgi:hypothetical protein